MNRQDTMLSIGKHLNEKFIYVYTESSLLKFSPQDTMISFDGEWLKLKTNLKSLDVSIKYSSVKSIKFRNR